VQGPQTARVVVGPAGEEIFTDKYGRVKVQFHWDRYGKKDENSSCWVRVSQPWAGKNWGAIHIPRIGQEVIVDFLEGDPDQPIITGRVYNAEQMPPYDLPANKTQSGILTRSSKGGGAGNFNEIRFEDKKGAEQLFIHAEKNQDIEVENDETHWVGHDRTKTIDHDETTHVKHDRTETVDNNETITIGVTAPRRSARTRRSPSAEPHRDAGGAHHQRRRRPRTPGGRGRTTSVGKDDSLKVGKNLTSSMRVTRSRSRPAVPASR
jgi:type VI secretion system secreted protein VgrG